MQITINGGFIFKCPVNNHDVALLCLDNGYLITRIGKDSIDKINNGTNFVVKAVNKAAVTTQGDETDKEDKEKSAKHYIEILMYTALDGLKPRWTEEEEVDINDGKQTVLDLLGDAKVAAVELKDFEVAATIRKIEMQIREQWMPKKSTACPANAPDLELEWKPEPDKEPEPDLPSSGSEDFMSCVEAEINSRIQHNLLRDGEMFNDGTITVAELATEIIHSVASDYKKN